MRDGSKTGGHGDFAHGRMGIQQEILRVFHAQPGQIIHEGHPHRFTEQFAEIIRAEIGLFRHIAQMQPRGLIFPDERQHLGQR